MKIGLANTFIKMNNHPIGAFTSYTAVKINIAIAGIDY